MNPYRGRYAQLYDLLYAAKPYAEEARFVRQCLRDFGSGESQRILELACGTGSHAFEFEQQDLHVTALDYSPEMIAVARHKAGAKGSSVKFQEGDMRQFDISGPPFDAVICLFDSIGFAHTSAAIRGVMRNVHQHLRPNGLFVFEFWHAPAMLRHHDPLRVARWKTESGEIVRISETRLDYPSQLAQVSYRVYEMKSDGTYSSFEENQVNRYFGVTEMEDLLESAGLRPLQWFNGFARDVNISDETWHVVAVAQRP